MVTIKVSKTSVPAKVAGAIAGMIREDKTVQLMAIGSAAVYLAAKAIGMATEYLDQEDVHLYVMVRTDKLAGMRSMGLKFLLRPVPSPSFNVVGLPDFVETDPPELYEDRDLNTVGLPVDFGQ